MIKLECIGFNTLKKVYRVFKPVDGLGLMACKNRCFALEAAAR